MTLTKTSAPILVDQFYELVKRLVIQRSGLSYYDEHESDLMQKVQARIRALDLSGCEAYWNLLQENGAGRAELDLLIAELTIGETHFFRHGEMFDAIRQVVLPNVVERNRDCRRIRVWSAGCSIGAEAYSMSILIHEFLGDRAAQWDVSILGTDINREYLAQAQRGLFNDWALRSLSDELRMRYFERCTGAWKILPIFQRGVSFQYHNLVTHRFPSLVQNIVAFDVVLCRNVMIYFSEEVNHCLVANLHHSLANEGWLAVGHAEPQGNRFDRFRRVLAEGAVLYQKSTAEAENSAVCPGKGDKLSRGDATPRSTMNWLPLVQRATAPGQNIAAAAMPESHKRNAVDESLKEVRELADRGELEKAICRCTHLLNKNKLCPQVHFHFALLMDQAGHLDKAEHWLRKALYLDRDHVLAHFYLGLTSLRKGDKATARRALENVLDLTATASPCSDVEWSGELKVGDLRQIAQMHLSLLREAR